MTAALPTKQQNIPNTWLKEIADLHVGCRAQIVGLQNKVELNGLDVTILEEEEGGRRLLVELPDGDQKSVRIENLCPHNEPLHLEDSGAAGAAPAAAVVEQTDAAESPGRSSGQLHLEPWRLATCGGEAELEVDLAQPIAEVYVNGGGTQVVQVQGGALVDTKVQWLLMIGVACEVLSRFESRGGRQGAQLQIPPASDLAGGAGPPGNARDPWRLKFEVPSGNSMWSERRSLDVGQTGAVGWSDGQSGGWGW
eukprot:Skav235356  [mRNA]  locus=scaffold665:230193:236917:- [translate_table: standard]